jgi:uncharacterized protein
VNVSWLTPDEHTTAWGVPHLRAPQKRGIGFAYRLGLAEMLLDEPGLVDFLALSPDALFRERSFPGEHRLAFAPGLLADALRAARGRPLSIHGLSPSAAASPGALESYLDCLDALSVRRHVLWHSAHLTFLSTDEFGGRHHACARVHASHAIATTDGTLDVLVPRVRLLNERFGVPLLLDHLTAQLPALLHEEGEDARRFLHALISQTGSYLLLDLTQIDDEARTFGFDPYAALARLPLDCVAEVHLTSRTHPRDLEGGATGPEMAPRVWAMLDWVAQRTPRLAGIVYELRDEGAPQRSVAGLCAQLVRARLAWDLHCAVFAEALPCGHALAYAPREAHFRARPRPSVRGPASP